MGPILRANKEPQERPALERSVVANRAAQHRVRRFQGVQDRLQCSRSLDLNLHFAAHARQRSQMLRQYHTDHGSVCTSTESTAGRPRTIGAQLFPASGEAYTCPPVVPKYTPQESSESTAIASRNTLT